MYTYQEKTTNNFRKAQPFALIGESQDVKKICELVEEARGINMNVMVRGESGTGKDLVASYLNNSPTNEWTKENVKINCPSIPETLFESELFGHEAGAFTGAQKAKPGLIELAQNGALFLDEIGDLPVVIQAKLLQFIESKQFTHVGGTKSIKVNTRIISATNAHLEDMIEKKQFRRDLFYRLNEFSIVIPPLRERIEDIPQLVNHFCFLFEQEFDKEKVSLSQEILARMMEYSWPGNVRELRAIIKRFVFSEDEKVLLNAINAETPLKSNDASLRKELKNRELNAIQSALIQTKWNRREAAKVLGLSYSSLRRRIYKYNI